MTRGEERGGSMTEALLSEAFQHALDTESWDEIEEKWLESLDAEIIPVSELLALRKELFKAGKRHLARTLLELLVETLESGNSHKATLRAIRELLRLTEKPGEELIERVEKTLRNAYADKPSLEIVMSHYTIKGSRHPFEVLENIETWLGFDVGSPVEVIKQGVGRVVELNLKLGNLKVDLGGLRPVSIPSGAIQKFVRPLPEGSFLWEKVVNPEELSEKIRQDPPGTLAHLLEGFDEAVSVSVIKNALDTLLPKTSWSSWWTKARKNPRVLSSGSGSRLQYSISGSAEDAARRLLEDLRNASPENRPKLARALLGRGAESAESAAAFLAASLDELSSSQPGTAWETAEVLKSFPGGLNKALSIQKELASHAPPIPLLNGITERSSKNQVLDAIRENRPEEWESIWAEWLLSEKNASILEIIAADLEHSGAEKLLDTSLESIFRNHLQHPPQFLWACESMVGENAPQLLRQRMRPSLLEKIPDSLSRKEYASLRGRAKALLGPGQVSIRIILEKASPAQAQRFSQRIARINAVDPFQVRLVEQALTQCRGPVTAEEIDPSELFVATAEAIEAARAELRQLLDEEIPKTLKGIQAAAAEGDLRENFEYHMLRDRQELQSARAAKLQEDLSRVRVLEHDAADTSRVNIGTIISFEVDEGETPEAITILGAWDADIEKRIYANGTDLAKKLFGLQAGDKAEIDDGTAIIARIESW